LATPQRPDDAGRTKLPPPAPPVYRES